MKKSSLWVVIIPLLIALLVIGSVVVVRYFSPVPETSQAANPTPASYPALVVPTGKPEVGFDEMQPIAPVSDLRQEYNDASDSSQSEIDALEQEASSL
jgi:hypothetical protein